MGDAPPEERFMRMSEFSTDTELLMSIQSMTGSVFQAVVASTGNKPPRIKPINGPKTAYQDLRRKKRVATHRSLVARVIQKKTP